MKDQKEITQIERMKYSFRRDTFTLISFPIIPVPGGKGRKFTQCLMLFTFPFFLEYPVLLFNKDPFLNLILCTINYEFFSPFVPEFPSKKE